MQPEYVRVDRGRCADWDDENWILTPDSVSVKDRGTHGDTLVACQKRCSTAGECRFFSYVNLRGRWCYLWKGSVCNGDGYGGYTLYRKTTLGYLQNFTLIHFLSPVRGEGGLLGQ